MHEIIPTRTKVSVLVLTLQNILNSTRVLLYPCTFNFMHAYPIHIFSFSITFLPNIWNKYLDLTPYENLPQMACTNRRYIACRRHACDMPITWSNMLATGHRLLVHNCPCGNLCILGSDRSNMLEQTFSHHLILENNTPKRGDPSLVPPTTIST
jgi:hypothetical protein